MIPFRDKNPSGTFPIVTLVIIGLNGGAFIFELVLGSRLNEFVLEYGVVPAKVSFFLGHPGLMEAKGTFLPFFISMFLHGGFVHILGNMWYLWIFGDNVEDTLGHFKYFGFYIACGLVATILHVAINPGSGVPCIGASGAIAGVLGSYMITFPRARVLCILPLWIFCQIVELPAVIVLGFWFMIQFFNGTAVITTVAGDQGGVAWWAHIGGFLTGIILTFALSKKWRRRMV